MTQAVEVAGRINVPAIGVLIENSIAQRFTTSQPARARDRANPLLTIHDTDVTCPLHDGTSGIGRTLYVALTPAAIRGTTARAKAPALLTSAMPTLVRLGTTPLQAITENLMPSSAQRLHNQFSTVYGPSIGERDSTADGHGEILSEVSTMKPITLD